MRSQTVNRIVVRGPNWLGDAVMCEPALRGLKRLFPHAHLSLLVKPAVAELFKTHAAVDRVILYDDRGRHAGLTGKWTLAGDLRRVQFDLAVLFQNAFEAALFAFLAGVPRRYGYATDGRSLLLSEPVAPPHRRALVHQVDYYWNLLKPLGLTGNPPQPELAVLPEEERSMTERLTQSGLGETDVVIGMNPGSTYGGAKRWLPDRFAQTAERLCREVQDVQHRGAVVVILGAKGEEWLGRDIAARLSCPSVLLSGATTIRELVAVLKRCAVLITNDTGPMHIASAFRVPVVAIFGPTDWRRTSPYGGDDAIVRHPVDCAPCLLRECPIDHRCMTGVSVEMVFQAAVKQLVRHEARGEGRAVGSEPPNSGLSPRASRVAPPAVQAPLEGVTVFLDRDGTLNHDPGYLKSPADLKLLPSVAASLARLKAAGARLVVVTNQSGVGRGFFTLKDLEAVHARLQGLLEREDAALDAIYFCPHHPDDGCRCRKPGTGMVDRAAAELQIDVKRSYLIGDHARDMQLARTVGAKAVLVTQGVVDEQGRAALEAKQAMPDLIAKSMAEAVEWIVEDAKTRQSLIVNR